jgi:hypothetical protein
VARAEVRLWQASSAILGSIFVLFILGAIGLGVWLGGGAGGVNATPTPATFNAGLLATPLINAQVNPLVTVEGGGTGPGEPTATATENVLLPPLPPVTATPTFQLIEVQSPTPTPTQAPLIAPTFTHTPTPTFSPTPSPTATSQPSPLETPSLTPTATSTGTLTATPTTTPTGVAP